jgi:hypothetical protein
MSSLEAFTAFIVHSKQENKDQPIQVRSAQKMANKYKKISMLPLYFS